MNTIELAKIYQTNLDKQVIAGAATGFMEVNADQVIYNGGNEVKIPKMTMDGLADYDRANGFSNGAIDFSYETHTLTQDRGRSFSLDAMDVNETNFALTAGSVMGEFQRTRVIPEIDAYRISKIASLAIAGEKAVGGYTPKAEDILAKLKADIAAVKDIAGEVELVIMIAQPVLAVLEQANQVTRFLNVGTLMKGDVETSVQSLDGCPIVAVPSARMKTAYEFGANGFTPDAGAKNVNWIVVPKTAPIAVSKTEAIRIFDPNQNQTANAWKIDYRKYHDLFLPENQLEAVVVNVKEALA